jgi:D-3-phosphoglycerate dehydrogenase / 2-oxoglutarate reductase
MPAFRVAVADSVFPNLETARGVLAPIDADLFLVERQAALGDVARDADAILVTYAKIDGETIRRLTRCRIISRFGIGVDNVDIAAATAASIVVTKVPDYCIDEVSEHTMALLLALARKVPFSNARVHGGEWSMPSVVPIHRLRGTTLGLVGFGRIPQLVAPKAQAFGITVIAADPFVSPGLMQHAKVECVTFDDLIVRSDFVSIHAPLTADTRHLFNADVFARMKPGAYLVNTSRGPLVDEAALVAALTAGTIAGAALDVIEQEPLPPGSALVGCKNLILTPHTAFYSEESLVDLQRKAAEEVVRVLSGKQPLNPVNPEALSLTRTV